MTVIRIKICRQTGPYERVPQNRFWFVPNGEQGIVEYKLQPQVTFDHGHGTPCVSLRQSERNSFSTVHDIINYEVVGEFTQGRN